MFDAGDYWGVYTLMNNDHHLLQIQRRALTARNEKNLQDNLIFFSILMYFL